MRFVKNENFARRAAKLDDLGGIELLKTYLIKDNVYNFENRKNAKSVHPILPFLFLFSKEKVSAINDDFPFLAYVCVLSSPPPSTLPSLSSFVPSALDHPFPSFYFPPFYPTFLYLYFVSLLIVYFFSYFILHFLPYPTFPF